MADIYVTVAAVLLLVLGFFIITNLILSAFSLLEKGGGTNSEQFEVGAEYEESVWINIWGCFLNRQVPDCHVFF